MARNTQHNLQPQTDHDGMSRRLAVLAAKQAIRGTLEAELKQQFQNQASPALEQLPAYPVWSAANRAAQDRMWSLLAQQVDDDYARIQRTTQQYMQDAEGVLELNDGNVPNYQHQANIHGQPGGYMLDRTEVNTAAGDLASGILYEAGGNLYALGQGIGQKDSKGQRLIAHIRETYPELQPARILEMGCSAGGQSCDYPAAFPEAEVWAIDLSPGMLRYAFARAQALDTAVNFRQADAANTGFEDQSFDLIVSHNMFHEVSAGHMAAIMRECHRLLAPGGVVIHQDVPIQFDRLDDWMKALSAWQKDHNDEPFWMDFSNADLPALLAEAGFERAQVVAEYVQALDGPIPWYLARARKSLA